MTTDVKFFVGKKTILQSSNSRPSTVAISSPSLCSACTLLPRGTLSARISVACAEYSQLLDHTHDVAGLEGVVQLDDARMLQHAHDVHLSLHVTAVFSSSNAYELGSKCQPCALLLTAVHCPELASGTQAPHDNGLNVPDISGHVQLL